MTETAGDDAEASMSWSSAVDHARHRAVFASGFSLKYSESRAIAAAWNAAADAWEVAADALEEAGLTGTAANARSSANASRWQAKHARTLPFLLVTGHLDRGRQFQPDLEGTYRFSIVKRFIRDRIPAQGLVIEGRRLRLLTGGDREETLEVYADRPNLRRLVRDLNRGT